MSKGKPLSPAWARYYRIHTNVLASWNEEHGYEPNCPCERCREAETAMATCKYCDQEIEDMGPGIGWVETRSGDDGGMYDLCPGNWDDEHNESGPHQPREN